MNRIVVLAGGSPHAHDFRESGRALAGLAADAGFDVDVADHPDKAVEMLASGASALLMCGLWWRMEGEQYDEWRDEYGYATTDATRAGLTSFVADGGGLLGLHTAPICFDDWAEWGSILGGAWRWGASSHPPLGPVRVDLVGSHPVIAGLAGPIEVTDEIYGDLAVASDIDVLGVSRRDPADDEQSVIWAHTYGRGRVVYDGLGHDSESILDPRNAAVLSNAIEWITEGT